LASVIGGPRWRLFGIPPNSAARRYLQFSFFGYYLAKIARMLYPIFEVTILVLRESRKHYIDT